LGTGLTARLGLTASVAAIIVVFVFSLLAAAISDMQRQTSERREALRVRLAADALQKSVLDLETGVRAFLITRDGRFLAPWRAARDRLPREQQILLARVAPAMSGDAGSRALARRIDDHVGDYLNGHSLPLVRRVQSDPLTPRELAAQVTEGKQQVDLLRSHAPAEYRDEDTYRHTQRVGRNAAIVADRLGLSEESIELIRAAAPLHDVGKIGVADSIMLKPDRLTPNEFEAMREHVRIGASILGSSSQPLFQSTRRCCWPRRRTADAAGPHGCRRACVGAG
jgi:HD-GYP domain-containing protein (c-di-GMP phosphodiesterase class II)